MQVIEKAGGGGWTRTNDLGIMSLIRGSENKQDQSLTSADSGKVRQNPQPRRNKGRKDDPNAT